MVSKVSIVISNWNGYEDTVECLNSIFKMDFVDYEIILVDDCSSDESVKEFKKIRDKRIKLVINKTNLGFAGSFNAGVRYALDRSSKYIMILNNDMVVDRYFLAKLVDVMDKNNDIAVISPAVYSYYSKNNLSELDFPGKFDLKRGGGRPWLKNPKRMKRMKSHFKVDYASGSCWMIRRGILKHTGLFNEKFFGYAEEIDVAMRLKELGYSFYINPDSKIWHKVGASFNKISGLRLYLSTKNMIWLERIYASKIEFLFFLFNFFFKKLPKKIYNILTDDNKIINLRSFFKAIFEGFFTDRKKFDSDKFYTLI